MTKRQRNKHYRNALYMLTEGEIPKGLIPRVKIYERKEFLMELSGICELLSISVGIPYADLDIEKNFPEMFAVKPKTIGLFWWDVKERLLRANYLKEFIEKTK